MNKPKNYYCYQCKLVVHEDNAVKNGELMQHKVQVYRQSYNQRLGHDDGPLRPVDLWHTIIELD